MDKIPLRSYLKEIENLIDKGENDQAIAHCRHILKAYPKNLATYRLLGKAYLEYRRYGDAADVFQRVLSGAPDDFVSHVGMSIIREDESNQDAAIWHMERAFEIQPYNSAIQDELRRLYGRRDGLEPPKVRLTRGALARMYARGNLYQQAIGELRAALAEDPKRSDLQVLLARMYFMAGQKVEAVETCSSLLKKLPYCLEANRIISAILPETERKEETQVYRERVMSLDPYLVLASPYEISSEGVRDQVVVIEKLDYQEGQMDEGSQPAWAASLGVTFEEFKSGEESVPDWLQAISDGQAPVRPAIPSQPPAQEQVPSDEADSPFLSQDAELIPSAEGEDELPSWISFPDQASGKASQSATGEIPEWMKEAGWEASSGSVESSLPDFEYPEGEEIDDAEIEKGELPSWLQSLAPAEAETGESLTDEEAVLASMPWLNEAGTEREQTEQVQETESDWLEEIDSKPAEAAAEAPDWLQELEEASLPGAEAAVEPDMVTEEADLAPGGAERESNAIFEPELDEVESEATVDEQGASQSEDEESRQAMEVEEITTTQAELDEGMPDWLKEVDDEVDAATGEPVDLETEAMPEAVDLGGAIFGEDEESDEGMPDWLKDSVEEAAEEQSPAYDVDMGIQPVDEELEDAGEKEIGLTENLEAESGFQVEQGDAPLEEAQEALGEADQAELEAEELPDWLKELGGEQPEQGQVEAEITAPDLEQAALAEELPDWMQEIRPGVAEARTEEAQAEEGGDFEGFEDSEDIPDWLREFGQEEVETRLDEIKIDELDPDETMEEAQEVPTEEIPDWLRDLEEENLAQEQTDLKRIPAKEPHIALESLETSQAEDEQDWLQIIGEEPLRSAPIEEDRSQAAEPELSPEDLDALLADTQPVRVSAEEPLEPFNEILEEIDTGMQAPEMGEAQGESSDEQESAFEDLDGQIEGVEPGIFGAALAAAAAETVPGEETSQVEEEQAPVSEDAGGYTPFELDDQDAGMAWLESLAAKHGVSEDELFTSPVERPDAFPFEGEAGEAVEVEAAEPVRLPQPTEQVEAPEAATSEQQEIEPVDQVSEEGLDWAEEAALAEADQLELTDVPDWLEKLKTEDQVEPEVETDIPAFTEAADIAVDVESPEPPSERMPAEELPDEEIPGWLREVQSEAEEELSKQADEASAVQEPDLEDSDAAMAWLESLAAKQGVPEDELFTKPEERLETPPAWVDAEEEGEKISPDEEIEASQAPIQAEAPAEQLVEEPVTEESALEEGQIEVEPDIISGAEQVEEAPPGEPAPTKEPELPDWLAESEKEDTEEVEWAMPVEPVKAALREPRPGTAPLATPPAQPVDINKAALVDLETIPGVGFILAQNILTYREAFGLYEDIEDLVKVPGITAGILAEIREYLTVPPIQEAPRPVEPELLDEAQASLLMARNKLAEGDVEGTVAQYSKLVKNPELLPEIIRDLKEALYRFPVDIGLWQTLGDAYMRSDQLSEALEAYTKAEELLR